MTNIKQTVITPLPLSRLEETRLFLRTLIRNEFNMEARLKEMDHLEASYGTGDGGFWIAVEQCSGQIVGCVGLIDVGMRRGYLKRMYISSAHRSSGLGTRLLLTLLNHADAHGLRHIYLATDYSMTGAQRFYERHGFERIEILPEDIDPYDDPLFYALKIEKDSQRHLSAKLDAIGNSAA